MNAARTRGEGRLVGNGTSVGSGARRDELAHVRMEDIYLNECRIWLGRTKGGRPRDAYLHPTAVEALRR